MAAVLQLIQSLLRYFEVLRGLHIWNFAGGRSMQARHEP